MIVYVIFTKKHRRPRRTNNQVDSKSYYRKQDVDVLRTQEEF